MRETVNWLPGELVVIAALLLGALFVVLSKRRQDRAVSSAAEDDLTAKYNGLLGELREHVANRHLLPTDAWDKEKSRLEQAAVAVLKQRDAARVAENHESLKAEARADKRQAVAAGGGSTMKGVLIGAGTVGFFVLLGFLLTNATTPRKDGMGITGTVPQAEMPAGAGGPPGPSPAGEEKLKALFDVVQKQPDDIEALADLSLHLLRRQGFDEAKPFILRGTTLDPFHVRTRVARTVLSAVEGSLASSQDELERLGSRYGEAYDANLFAGLIAMDQNDQRRALVAFERYFAVAPAGDTPPMMKMAVEQMRQQFEAPNEPPGK